MDAGTVQELVGLASVVGRLGLQVKSLEEQLEAAAAKVRELESDE